MVWLSTDPETISFYWFDQPGGISTNTPPVCVCVCSRGKSLPAGCWDVLKTADGGDRWTSLRGDSGVCSILGLSASFRNIYESQLQISLLNLLSTGCSQFRFPDANVSFSFC